MLITLVDMRWRSAETGEHCPAFFPTESGLLHYGI
jgi:hypothetical protein